MKRTEEQFMVRFKGIKVHLVTRAMNKLTPGINWSGCSKASLARSWAQASYQNKLDCVELDAIEQAMAENDRALRAPRARIAR